MVDTKKMFLRQFNIKRSILHELDTKKIVRRSHHETIGRKTKLSNLSANQKGFEQAYFTKTKDS